MRIGPSRFKERKHHLKTKPSKPSKPKRNFTPESRLRISEAQKKRWRKFHREQKALARPAR